MRIARTTVTLILLISGILVMNSCDLLNSLFGGGGSGSNTTTTTGGGTGGYGGGGGGGGGGGSQPVTISGNVSNTTSQVKIGIFSGAQAFASSDPSNNSTNDVISTVSPGPAGSYTPLHLITVDGAGNYNAQFPLNTSGYVQLIAWVDTNGDGVFDLGALTPEQGYLPRKSVGGNNSLVADFYYLVGTSTVFYLHYTYNNSTNAAPTGGVGTTGYNFNKP